MSAHVFYPGQRVRVSGGHSGAGVWLVGLEGVVDSVPSSGVVVILDADPALKHRVSQEQNYEALQPRVIRRFFLLGDLEPA